MKSTCLFEISWEVCNKVGGIHTVISTKAKYAIKEFGDNYFVVGPDLGTNSNFISEDTPYWKKIREKLESKNIFCRFGRWNIKGQPKAILVPFKDRYDSNKLLFDIWQDFGVDSFGGRWEYVEPVMFSTACAEVVEIISSTLSLNSSVIAHFHEWMCGAGLLYLKKNCPNIATVFTTHATVLGRSLAGTAIDVYAALENINPEEEARRFNVQAKHSMEKAATREADCFTTVSEITAYETKKILNRIPDYITLNGIFTKELNNLIQDKDKIKTRRSKLINIASKILQKKISEDTMIWLTSGRYEVHNKGYDVLLESLSELDKKLQQDPDSPPIIMFILVAAGHLGLSEHSKKYFLNENIELKSLNGIATHRVYDEYNDQILKLCHSLALINNAQNKINIIFSTAYLDGHDGVFDMPYYDILSACDLSIFPSFYEPWGYTPLESIALSVPTITTDLAGFGVWASQKNESQCVAVLARNNDRNNQFSADFLSVLEGYKNIGNKEMDRIKKDAFQLALKADWSVFYPIYMDTYLKAKSIVANRMTSFLTTKEYNFNSYSDSGFKAPRFHSFTVIPAIPDKIDRLLELSYNLWWTWNSEIIDLFEFIDAKLFIESERNPIKFLFQLKIQTLNQISKDQRFLKKYHETLKIFDAYMTRPIYRSEKISTNKAPFVAYFSLEFGLHESLPIYSGGLGVLAGDHLKAASDLNFPLVAVGLLYKQGYFKQTLNSSGDQIELFESHDFSQLPIKTVSDLQGNDLLIELAFPGRAVKARVWIAQVGTVSLYLLDTDIQENAPQDRIITRRLYDGDKKTRLKQELLLGLGGVKLLEDDLGLNPAAYHLNEGHSAFLLIERLKRFMDKKLTFLEAIEALRHSSVFTTHTPVPAGHETYEMDMMSYYMEKYLEKQPILLKEIYRLGTKGSEDIFSMTLLALRLCVRTNAVSKLHQAVTKEMFKDFWEGFSIPDVPILSVTNGVHIDTWLGSGMKSLFMDANIQWKDNKFLEEEWQQIKLIPDDLIWYRHLEQKQLLLDFIKNIVVNDFSKRGEKNDLIEKIIAKLDPNVLIIGFARRFASYKRANLLFKNINQLSKVLKDPEKPAILIIAGKAHPSDKIGKDILRNIIDFSRSEELKGHIIVLENYNLEMAKYLVQGVDVWLNTPVFKKEASGTSGIKAAINGVINVSVCDGWWREGYHPDLGYGIEADPNLIGKEESNQYDFINLLQILEHNVKPLYYQREENEYPKQWVIKMKNSMAAIIPGFSAKRMLNDYVSSIYIPTIEQNDVLYQDNYKKVKLLTEWKNKIRSRFMSLKVEKLTISGLQSDCLTQNQKIKMQLTLSRGKMQADEVQVQLVIAQKNIENEIIGSASHNFSLISENSSEQSLFYEIEHKVHDQGYYYYGVRLIPYHPFLAYPLDVGIMYWV